MKNSFRNLKAKVTTSKQEFIGLQKTLEFTQTNHGNIDQVFPLLCPVREADWLDGWEYKMIHSKSGLIEQDCVFSTPHHGKFETIWQVTQYDKEHYHIEFVRLTPKENIVKINIKLKEIDTKTTQADISYQYTALNPEQNEFIKNELEQSFKQSMNWWEKAINHYLATNKMLLANN